MNKILKLILVFFNLSKKYADSVAADAVQSDTVTTIWTGTQAAYDQIDPKDAHTLYFIEEEA